MIKGKLSYILLTIIICICITVTSGKLIVDEKETAMNFMHEETYQINTDKIYTTDKTEDLTMKASISYNSTTGNYSVLLDNYDEACPAFTIYRQEMERTGWDSLAISSYQGEDNKYSDETKAYAMGYLEGYLTQKKIKNHYLNCNGFFNYPTGKMTDGTKEFLTKNIKWIKDMYMNKTQEDSYWHHAYLILRQYEGLIDAYNSLAEQEDRITVQEAMIMNSHDITELAFWKNKEKRPKFNLMSSKEIEDYHDLHTHCSALIKVKEDFSDVWFGHNTWTSFASMTRIFKEYRFKTNNKSEKARTIAMSSYPGAINSIDDFYITSKDLYVTETTNTVFNNDLYDLLTPESILVWQRVMIANRLSDNGKDWTKIFSLYNSGTYNNQFQVLDLKLIDPDQKTISENALWIVEQIPGYTESADVTHILKYGYWPGYNSAYFTQVRLKAGYDDILSKHPELRDSLDYSTCARANIFRRDSSKVTDLESFKSLMRFNQFQKDPLSKSNPTYAIASRKDLSQDSPDCRGATDAKIASIRDIKATNKKKINIIAGPTTDDQEPFDTIDAKCVGVEKGKFVFNGLPKKFSYTWINYETILFDN